MVADLTVTSGLWSASASASQILETSALLSSTVRLQRTLLKSCDHHTVSFISTIGSLVACRHLWFPGNLLHISIALHTTDQAHSHQVDVGCTCCADSDSEDEAPPALAPQDDLQKMEGMHAAVKDFLTRHLDVFPKLQRLMVGV